MLGSISDMKIPFLRSPLWLPWTIEMPKSPLVDDLSSVTTRRVSKHSYSGHAKIWKHFDWETSKYQGSENGSHVVFDDLGEAVEVFDGDAAAAVVLAVVVAEGDDADVVVRRGLLHHGRDVEVAPAVHDAVVNLQMEVANSGAGGHTCDMSWVDSDL